MKQTYSVPEFRKILIPLVPDYDAPEALQAVCGLFCSENVLLVGLIQVEASSSLSLGTEPASKFRGTLRKIAENYQVRSRARVRVAHSLWKELVSVANDEQPDLLVLEWPAHFEALGVTVAEALAHSPCDLAVIRSPATAEVKRILLPLRGGPYAELALRLSLFIGGVTQAKVTSLHLYSRGEAGSPEEPPAQTDAPFKGIANVLANLPEVNRQELWAEDKAETILSISRQYDLVVMGASARQRDGVSFGPVAERVLRESPAGVLVVKTRREMPEDLESELVGGQAISILVDKWFAENTFHSVEFEQLERLLALKRLQNLSISLALPALNEEKTVGKVIETVKRALMDEVPLLDEIVLMDSDSTDRTREIAQSLGVPVYIHQHVLTEYGTRRGKGEALWKSLFVTSGDIVLWIDTDIVNVHPRFIYGLLGPLLANPGVQFVKGFYRRPIKVGEKIQAGGGGRVTELAARPLLNLFYPELSGVVQPLSGEYGGRRAALEQMAFFSGYGVEIGLLIDTFEKFGLSAIAQVDLVERIHHNQSLESLSKMSFAIIQAVIRRLERRYGRGILEEVNKTMKLIHYETSRFFLEVEEIAEKERPPMASLPEYQGTHQIVSLDSDPAR
jgi:glucosyl-3-phosphoglycerate synthase